MEGVSLWQSLLIVWTVIGLLFGIFRGKINRGFLTLHLGIGIFAALVGSFIGGIAHVATASALIDPSTEMRVITMLLYSSAITSFLGAWLFLIGAWKLKGRKGSSA